MLIEDNKGQSTIEIMSDEGEMLWNNVTIDS